MARLRQLGVRCLVAPCEADAQLAHLALTGQVQACATEDVDLLAFGCQRVIFGLHASGHGREIQLAQVGKSRGLAPYRVAPETLKDLCVLSGCDYLPAIPRLGLKTASQLLHRSRGDVARALHLARREGFQVPAGYDRLFQEARLAYVSQTVFGIAEGRLQPLRPLPAGADVTPGCLGPDAATVPEEVARGVAEGRLNPATLEPFVASVAAAFGSQADLPAASGQLVAVTRDVRDPQPFSLRSIDSQRGLEASEDGRLRRPAASPWDLSEAEGASSASQIADVLTQFRPPRSTGSPQACVKAPARQPLAADGLADSESSSGDDSMPAGMHNGSAAEAESRAPAVPAAAAEGRSPAVPFRPPRLLTGASPGTAEAFDESLAKRRRLGCRVGA
uniref:XPG-I domain-containing protein n=1 Tax=Alexandrium catenella TaxID=2925 RepID=A0A7S1RAK6_ALECA